MKFPLYRRPWGVVFLDDDPDYLDLLSEVMPGQWPVRLFVDARGFIHQMQQEPPRLEADVWRQHEIIEHWHQGEALIPQILRYWATQPQRHAIVRVCAVDYAMPAMNGLQALAELVDWPGSRLLLTGRADEQIAVDAFNRGLIEQYIPKQSADLSQRLISTIQNMLDMPHERHEAVWRATLSASQHALLRHPSTGRALEDIARKAGWVEHVVIGQPLGVLGLNARGQAAWLQLEPADGLASLAEMAREHGLAAADVRDIAQGRKLIDLELRSALGTGVPARLVEAFDVDADATLRGALFPIDAARQPGEAAGYAAFLHALGARKLIH